MLKYYIIPAEDQLWLKEASILEAVLEPTKKKKKQTNKQPKLDYESLYVRRLNIYWR